MYEKLLAKIYDLIPERREESQYYTAKTLEQAADAIEELEEKAQAYAETLYAYEHPWIPVTERLPEENVSVLTWGEQAVVLIDWLHNGKWVVIDGVTHWMPLPQPPKEEI